MASPYPVMWLVALVVLLNGATVDCTRRAGPTDPGNRQEPIPVILPIQPTRQPPPQGPPAMSEPREPVPQEALESENPIPEPVPQEPIESENPMPEPVPQEPIVSENPMPELVPQDPLQPEIPALEPLEPLLLSFDFAPPSPPRASQTESPQSPNPFLQPLEPLILFPGQILPYNEPALRLNDYGRRLHDRRLRLAEEIPMVPLSPPALPLPEPLSPESGSGLSPRLPLRPLMLSPRQNIGTQYPENQTNRGLLMGYLSRCRPSISSAIVRSSGTAIRIAVPSYNIPPDPTQPLGPVYIIFGFLVVFFVLFHLAILVVMLFSRGIGGGSNGGKK